ncbi:hypothetical protein C8R45DRAFT_1076760 [Mycena sanguinolenta]|nr:hypothetical protein C8R45DRAFT_1076760 [Mycena sanguinolenta]
MGLKTFVAGLALMMAVRCCQCLAIMWIQNVTLFGDVEAGSHMWERYWVSKTDVMLEATGATYVQIFFCRRLWASILSTPHSIQRSFNTQAIARNAPSVQVAIHLGIVLCGDLLLTGSTVFYLLRHSNTAFIPSRSPFAITMKLLLRLTIQMTVRYQSAAPAALCTLTNFVADIRIYATEIQDPQSLMVGFITTLMIPQLYAWSAMWTLNSREDIRVAVDNRPYTTVNLGTSVAASADSQTENTPRVGENGTVSRQVSQHNCVCGKAEKLTLVV